MTIRSVLVEADAGTARPFPGRGEKLKGLHAPRIYLEHQSVKLHSVRE